VKDEVLTERARNLVKPKLDSWNSVKSRDQKISGMDLLKNGKLRGSVSVSSETVEAN
jgi:hypothetical protein